MHLLKHCVSDSARLFLAGAGAGAAAFARALMASSMTQFFISGLVLLVAVMGGLINFQLIAMPMAEMVGGNSYTGGFKTSVIAALVIIMVEIAMGLFLLESLRITKLFPVIAHMDDKMRKRMMVITFSILFILAGIEASLAYMRDLLALDREALKQSLAGVSALNAEFRWIPSIGQMVMGFILPFALAFVAIPLESFIHASRTVLGVMTVAVLRTLIICLRLVGGLAHQLSKMLVFGYDMLITVPLSLEKLVRQGINARHESRVAGSAEQPVVLSAEPTDSALESQLADKPRASRRRTKTAAPDTDLAAQQN